MVKRLEIKFRTKNKVKNVFTFLKTIYLCTEQQLCFLLRLFNLPIPNGLLWRDSLFLTVKKKKKKRLVFINGNLCEKRY